MDKKINKSSLKEAKANFEEIQKFAVEEATKNIQEDVNKKVVEIMNNSLKEDSEIVQEDVTINTDGTTITIDNNGDVEVETDGEVEGVNDLEGTIENEPEENEPEEIVVSDEDDEVEIDNSELEDMENIEEINFNEQDEMAAPVAPEAAPVAPEAEPVAPEAEVAPETPEEDTISNPFEMLADKMDQMMAMMGGSPNAGDEDVEIIDDTEEAAPEMAAPAPAPAPSPAPAAPVSEEITFEVVNDMEGPEMEDDVLEIVGEDEEEIVDENTMSGQGYAVRRAAGNQDDAHGRTKPEVASNRRRIKENKENKAQYEAKLAELIKENNSLKSEKKEIEQELIKFENGFIKLQENFEEMQDYNAKLVMAYKVAMAGGLTTDEKIQISEQFDKCETIKEAENLYKSIVSEHQIKVNKNPEKSIKSTSIKSTPSKSTSQPLYESREVVRMKELAGIKKNEN